MHCFACGEMDCEECDGCRNAACPQCSCPKVARHGIERRYFRGEPIAWNMQSTGAWYIETRGGWMECGADEPGAVYVTTVDFETA